MHLQYGENLDGTDHICFRRNVTNERMNGYKNSVIIWVSAFLISLENLKSNSSIHFLSD